MNVFLFKIDKDRFHGYGTGLALVAANDASEAWDTLYKELPDYDRDLFSAEKYEKVHSLTSLLNEPSVITYNCYVE